MGQCQSTAQCCSDPTKQCRQMIEQPPHDPGQTSLPVRPPPTNGTNGASPTATNTVVAPESSSSDSQQRPTSTLQLSLSLGMDDQSEHSLCIKLELPEGTTSVLVTSQHGSVSRNLPIPSGAAQQPDKQHHKDIYFSAKPGQEQQRIDPPATSFNQPEGSIGASSLHGDRNKECRHDFMAHKIDSRRSAFRKQQDNATHRRPLAAVSDGALLGPQRHPMMETRESSWYNLGYVAGLEASGHSLDLAGAFSQMNSGSDHTTSSWGDMSLRKSLEDITNNQSQALSSCQGSKATFPPMDIASCCQQGGNNSSINKPMFTPPLDISMNDVSGNTVPTRCEYDDLDDDIISETEDEDEMDYMWDYRRNIRALSMESNPGHSVVRSSSSSFTDESSINTAPLSNPIEKESTSRMSSSPILSSPRSFFSNLSSSHSTGLGRPKSFIYRQDKGKNKLWDKGEPMSRHSDRSCQSDSYMFLRRNKASSSASASSCPVKQKTLGPMNPHNLPFFHSTSQRF